MTSSIARNRRDMQDTILAATVAGAVMGTAGPCGLLALALSISHILRNDVHEHRLLNCLTRAVKIVDMVVHTRGASAAASSHHLDIDRKAVCNPCSVMG